VQTSKHRTVLAVTRIAAIVLSIVTIITPAAATEATPDQTALVEGARREGQVRISTSAPAPGFKRFLAAFTAKYPFIDVAEGFYSAPAVNIASRLRDEMASKTAVTDVIHTANLADFIRMERQGQLLRYESAVYRELPAAAQSPRYWASARGIGTIIAYNKQALAPAQVPRAWRDLLKPTFAGGKIAIKDADAGTLFNQLYLLEQRLGGEFAESLADQKPAILQADKIITAIISRSILAGATVDHWRALTAEATEAGVVPVYPLEGMPLTLAPIAILADAPHPNAAKLFLDFTLSREGQQLLNTDIFGNYSMRSDVPASIDQRPLADAKPLLPTDWSDYLVANENFEQRFKSLFR
jgi:iron(III) transport system substrate-binding protein